MLPEEGITFGYDLQNIAGSALREREAGETVRSLDETFNSYYHEITPVTLNTEMFKAWYQIRWLSSFRPFVGQDEIVRGNFEMEASAPYETFAKDGFTFDSRVYRLRHTIPDSPNSNAYFLGLTTEGSVASPTLVNLRHGVLEVENRENIFFEARRNPNLGKPAVQESYVDPENERILSERRYIDKNKYIVTTVNPETQAWIVAEFNKFITHTAGSRLHQETT